MGLWYRTALTGTGSTARGHPVPDPIEIVLQNRTRTPRASPRRHPVHLVAFTPLKGFHTSVEISNDFPDDFSSPSGSSQAFAQLTDRTQPQMTKPFAPPPPRPAGASSLCGPVRGGPRIGTRSLAVQSLGHSSRHPTRGQYRGNPSTFRARAADQAQRRPTCRTPPGQSAGRRQALQTALRPGFDVTYPVTTLRQRSPASPQVDCAPSS